VPLPRSLHFSQLNFRLSNYGKESGNWRDEIIPHRPSNVVVLTAACKELDLLRQ
jgi:hypothetical protein